MRKLVFILCAALSALLLSASIAAARPQSISSSGAQNICSHHGGWDSSYGGGGGGCAWCGKINCSSVKCSSGGKCDVLVVKLPAAARRKGGRGNIAGINQTKNAGQTKAMRSETFGNAPSHASGGGHGKH